MTTPVTPAPVAARAVRPLLRSSALAFALLALAALFFVLAALVQGGAFKATGFGWLIPGGLASLTLALLCP